MNIELQRSALLVIDMQADFYAEGGSAVQRGHQVKTMQALPERIESFAEAIREHAGLVIFTRFLYDPQRTPGNFLELMEDAHGVPMCAVNTPGAALAGVSPQAGDEVIDKYTYDSFSGTNLLEVLKNRDIETVLISGVRTEVCVKDTASRAFAEGFRTVILSDLIATYDDRETTALRDLNYSSFVMTSAELLAQAAV